MEQKIKDVVEEFDKEFGFFLRDGTQIPISADPDKELKEKFMTFLVKSLTSLVQQSKEEVFKELKKDPTYCTTWLREYGLDDDDTLNAGEIEELLNNFLQSLSNTS